MSLVNSELIPDQNIQNLLQAYLVADQKVTQLKPRLGEAHPDLIGAIDARTKIKEQLDIQLRGYESSLGDRLQGSGSPRGGIEEPARAGESGSDSVGARTDASVRRGAAETRGRDAIR